MMPTLHRGVMHTHVHTHAASHDCHMIITLQVATGHVKSYCKDHTHNGQVILTTPTQCLGDTDHAHTMPGSCGTDHAHNAWVM